MIKKLVLHYEFMRDSLRKKPQTIKELAQGMEAEFGVNYNYVRREVEELVSLKKINRVKHNTEILLLWSEQEVSFEYDFSNNVVELDRQYLEFNVVPSKVRQMKLPMYVVLELGKKIVNLSEKIELMLELKAVKSDGVWYKIQRSEQKNG